MKKADIIEALHKVREAKHVWAREQATFNSSVEAVMTRLLHEAAVQRMSPEEVARESGFTPKRIRAIMRIIGLNPRDGKHLLSAKAGEALANNAALLGIEPRDMDLMSPLAYLPMGEQMKRELQQRTVSQVTELEHRCSALDTMEDGDGTLWYQCPECKHAVTVEALNKFGAGL